MLSVDGALAWVIWGMFAALTFGTIIRMVALRNKPTDSIHQRVHSLAVWWVLAGTLAISSLLGKLGAIFLLLIASTLALREYFQLIGSPEKIGRSAILVVAVIGCFHYGLLIVGMTTATMGAFPIVLLLALAAVRSIRGDTDDYIRTTAALYWGSTILIYGLSHGILLFDLNASLQPPVGTVGWFLFLVIITEMNDIMQAIVGRKLGKHKITPRVSPHKTVEGLIGGMVSSAVLALVLAPLLTTLTVGRQDGLVIGMPIFAGLLISLSGFLGDINMSAIKRDVGVKDGSNLFPGMGGMIDRVDSLTFTSPVFYYFVWFTTD